ncbi:MAG: hypothetical protein A3K67_00960 [Euryarchaeota archaeon RBG_16_62_10]|nr:MAG: hypothetical protein A3K67_00960 [Euryarchaeota archaeon RBG_16_62_10]
MSQEDLSEPIPREVAERLCGEIAAVKGKKLFSQCWGCLKFSKGDFSKMCAANGPGFRGCKLVNKRYDETRNAR